MQETPLPTEPEWTALRYVLQNWSPMVRRDVLNNLRAKGWIEPEEEAGYWRLTDAGREAFASGPAEVASSVGQ